ncbi:N-acetyl-gamma-glutamyl-phosphate reductase [Salinisphaera sp. USBA-960]|nr:N-acetyl-gamma-glutamyl-phosphate reductase [Salifodinibacter halophilus]NNC25376.1 N-acetyl-gamma-glutamyl-phosphate reductase [Salifodinibacter halophilus]
MSKPIHIGLVGATGYAGGELLRLLAARDDVCVSAITSERAKGQHVTDFYPTLRGWLDLSFMAPSSDALADCDVVFFATPHGVAMNLVPDLLAAGKRIIDLSADFRLRDAELWSKWYGQPHAAPDLLAEAVYGLPELSRAGIADARIVAVPGCYPTSTLLGLKPLLEASAIDTGDIIADAKTGVSGAGRTSKPAFAFSEVAESMHAYGVAGHRHLPEIQQALGWSANETVGLTFVPHLVPMIRGMEVTIYVRQTGSSDPQAVFEAAYADEPFVGVVPAGSQPATAHVRATNNAMVSVTSVGGDRLVVTSVIDNLLKGAAGQALQCLNLMIGAPETASLAAPTALP